MMENLIHIVFDEAGAENLKESFALDDIIAGEILVIEDDLACGPLAPDAGQQKSSRRRWWEALAGEEAMGGVDRDWEKLRDLGQQMRQDENNEVWIWAAQNARDVCGYYNLLASLADFTGRVHLIYLNNLPFLNEKGGVFYPVRLMEILPREFLKARRLAREVTAAEFEVDGEEWNRLAAEGSLLRILEGGKKIRGEAESYFDKELLNRCRLDYVKAWRLVSQVRQKNRDHISEAFLYGRLGKLLEAQALEANGPFRQLRDAELKALSHTPGEPPIIEDDHENDR
jgi:hypothetical protein